MADLVTVELSKRQLKFTPDSENTADSELDIHCLLCSHYLV